MSIHSSEISNHNFRRPALDRLDLRVNAQSLLSIDYPALGENHVIGIGVSIDWRQAEKLRAFALACTHAEEHIKAERFLRAEDGLRHLLGRALLRTVAAHYGGMDPTQPIPVNPWGKPEPLASIACNISHSGNQVWVALTRLPSIGIDIEHSGSRLEYRDIASLFHADEVNALQTSTDRESALMRCWTRKEAVSKAVGMGLSLPLNEYAVSCDPSPWSWLRVAPHGTSVTDWTVMDLPLDQGCLGALAVKGFLERVTLLRITTFE